MTAFFALAGALIVGASDFGGGLVARSAPALRVTAWIQASSLALIAVAAVLVDAPAMTSTDVGAGVVAGLSGTFSFAALYAAFGRGEVSRLAPVTAVIAAVLPAGVGALRGDDVGALAALGIAVAIVAIVLVAQEQSSTSTLVQATPLAAFGLAALAGVGFSIFFLALAETSEDAGLWPLVVARVVSLPIVAAVAMIATGGMALASPNRAIAIASGVGEAVANVFALLAFQRGPIPVAAVLSSFYPVSSVLLAWAVLGERLRRVQWVGVALALASVPLIAV